MLYEVDMDNVQILWGRKSSFNDKKTAMAQYEKLKWKWLHATIKTQESLRNRAGRHTYAKRLRNTEKNKERTIQLVTICRW